jgi:hypothetical protein
MKKKYTMQSVAGQIGSVLRRHHCTPSSREMFDLRVLTLFRDFIERTNWDEVLLRREKWFDTLCVVCIIFSVLYFIPVLVVSVMK